MARNHLLPLVFACLAIAASPGATSATAAEWFAAPSGSPSGAGTQLSPWDLAKALASGNGVAGGDTVWLGGGVYSGIFTASMSGATGNPIIIRPWAGEWVKLDGAVGGGDVLTVNGSWLTFRDLEITNSNTNRWGNGYGGVTIYGSFDNLTNCIIHDNHNSGIGSWVSSRGEAGEIYGCVDYVNGYDDTDRGHGHAMYTQNRYGIKRVENNIMCNGMSEGIQCYGSLASYEVGYEYIGNILFNTGVASKVSGHKDDFLVGKQAYSTDNGVPAGNILFEGNYGWAHGLSDRNFRFGWSNVAAGSLIVRDNYSSSDFNFVAFWNPLTMTGNTMGSLTGLSPSSYPNNTYLSAYPTVNKVVVLPNKYEAGRAHVAVYNWQMLDNVGVDLSGVVSPGATYTVRNGQNFFAPPVATGIFTGAPVSLPMNLQPAQPLGYDGAITAAEMTGKEFNAFVVTSIPGVAPVYGDLNGDGIVDMEDLNMLVDWILGRISMPPAGSDAFIRADVDGSGTVDTADLNLIVDYILGRIVKFPVQ